jgi:hypothetical protein
VWKGSSSIHHQYGLRVGGTGNDVSGADLRDAGQSGPLFDAGTGTIVERVPGVNPVGPSVITVGASPFTHIAGSSSETVSIMGGTVSSVDKNGVTLATQSNVSLTLAPYQSLVVTYTVAPTMAADVH